MNKTITIGIGLTLLLGMSLGGGACSFHDESVELEESVSAQWRQNQNNYDKFWKSITEMVQIPEQYKDDFKDVLVGNTEARYGKGGSDAQWQWIQEHAVEYDSSMYRQIMTAIEAGREDFEDNQKKLIDKQRRYKTHLHSATGKFWRKWMDFPNEVTGSGAPPEDADGDGFLTVLDYPIVTSKKTKKAFAEGEDEALDLRRKK
jgi:hypothetical protein